MTAPAPPPGPFLALSPHKKTVFSAFSFPLSQQPSVSTFAFRPAVGKVSVHQHSPKRCRPSFPGTPDLIFGCRDSLRPGPPPPRWTSRAPRAACARCVLALPAISRGLLLAMTLV